MAILKPNKPLKYVKPDGTTITVDEDGTIHSAGGGGGGSSYTFTNGLTETDGTVSWDLNDIIKKGSGNGSLILRREVSPNFNPTATDSIIRCYNGDVFGFGHFIFNGENINIQGQNHIASGQSLGLTIQGGNNNFFFGSGTMSANNI